MVKRIKSSRVQASTFYQQCERFCMLNSRIQELFNIKGYFRFKDDVLIIIGGSSESRKRVMSHVCFQASLCEFQDRRRKYLLYLGRVSGSTDFQR